MGRGERKIMTGDTRGAWHKPESLLANEEKNMAQDVLATADILLAEVRIDPPIVALHHQHQGART